jgi:hypothetical protein
MPQGLQFLDTGNGAQISGTPQVFGQFSFDVLIIDSSSSPIQDLRHYNLTIHESGSHPFAFVSATLPGATFLSPYGPQILVTGGTYPYHGGFNGNGLGFTFDENGPSSATSLVRSQEPTSSRLA